MQFDRTQLDQLLSMDDKSFSELARTIAEAAGADKAKAELLISNPELLKRRLSQISPEEASKLIDAAGREKSQEIMDMLNNRGARFGQ